MRFLSTASLAALLFSAPAFAQTPSNADTYKAIVEHGVVIMTPGLDIDVKFTPDGRFTALRGASSGVWHIDGEKMCSTPSDTLIETCGVYPPGKKSGDTFEIAAPSGSVTVRIP